MIALPSSHTVAATTRESSEAEIAEQLEVSLHAQARQLVEHGGDRNRQIGERERLVSEVAAWRRQRNASRARIKWMFTTERARNKLARAYPDTAKEELLHGLDAVLACQLDGFAILAAARLACEVNSPPDRNSPNYFLCAGIRETQPAAGLEGVRLKDDRCGRSTRVGVTGGAIITQFQRPPALRCVAAARPPAALPVLRS